MGKTHWYFLVASDPWTSFGGEDLTFSPGPDLDGSAPFSGGPSSGTWSREADIERGGGTGRCIPVGAF